MSKIKIEWQGSILGSTNDKPVLVKNQKNKPASTIKETAKKITGQANLRFEKKGRAGNPVVILFKFSDPEARNTESIKKLCSELKTKLACGGTVEDGEIVLILKDLERVKKTLFEHFQIRC